MNTNTAKSENYQRFVGFPKFASLIAGRTLEDYGVWQIFGEDSNPGLGGSHYTPLLATCEGKLGDVIEYAVELPGFWAWGGGGEIEKICVVKIDATTNQRRLELEKRATELARQLDAINDELQEIGGTVKE